MFFGIKPFTARRARFHKKNRLPRWVRPFFLITWFTDPPSRFFQDLEKTNPFFLFFVFTHFQLSVPSPDIGGGQINYGVQCTQ